ncbi:hypothetical protein CEP54_007291 [Fusarium duplospermum]|uniref:Uncharacterized protein n=1 Tax=Fusarium duplospermum TaxID=1325734 RepID=A0A428Q2B2_9HYPO|nr:hypothetical protein CEP54_007291 [Fusarium duplospermum]
MAAYRFFLEPWLIVIQQAAFFPAVHFVLGSWYRGHEINRRGGVFYTGYGLGSMTSSLLASAATSNLHGVYGLAGWRCLYIICFVITIPVGIICFFVLPGTVAQPNRWFLSKEDVEVTKRRLEQDGHKTSGKLKVHHIRRTLTSPRFWAVAFIDILWKNAGLYKTQGSYLLWIKSLGRYSASKVNQLGSTSMLRFRPPHWAGMGHLLLIALELGALWFAFTTSFWANAMSTVFHGWVNNLLRDSPEERSFTLVLINTIAEATTAVIPLGVFKTIESPTFPKGYPFCFGCAVGVIVVTLALAWYEERNRRLRIQRDDVEDSGLENNESISVSPDDQVFTVQSSNHSKS